MPLAGGSARRGPLSRTVHRGWVSISHRLGIPGHGDGSPRLVIINGHRIWIRPHEDVGCQIGCRGRFEEAETQVIRRWLQRESTCVDVGANVGYYTLLMASLAPEGSVHAFEPISDNCDLLIASLEENGYEHVSVRCAALGAAAGTAEFVVAADSAFSSLEDTARRPVLAGIRVPVMTLDSYCEQERIGRIDFLKIDVEGAEEQVLAGATRLLSSRDRRPKYMMLELYQPMLKIFGASVERVIDRLRGLQYQPFVTRGDRLTAWRPSDMADRQNVFFICDSDTD
jgi:FkbM family methyltransferase